MHISFPLYNYKIGIKEKKNQAILITLFREQSCLNVDETM